MPSPRKVNPSTNGATQQTSAARIPTRTSHPASLPRVTPVSVEGIRMQDARDLDERLAEVWPGDDQAALDDAEAAVADGADPLRLRVCAQACKRGRAGADRD